MITLLPAGNPGPFTGPTGNNTWLVDGAFPLLVDAGVGAHEHLQRLRALLGGRPLARVFLTHGHRDHAAGEPALRQAWPSVEVIGASHGVPPDRARVPAGDSDLEVLRTPGHAADHACLWDAEAGVLFSGDLIVSGSSVMIGASSGGDMREYLASLARVRALGPRRIYPGHGPVIEDGMALLDQYLAHRLEREAQVVAALSGGARTLAALIQRVYSDLDPALEQAARDTLLAHLQKLAHEGRARSFQDGTDERWQLTSRNEDEASR